MDPVFLIRGEANSETFLFDLRKLFQRGKSFVATKIS